jgi:hypothetical protein
MCASSAGAYSLSLVSTWTSSAVRAFILPKSKVIIANALIPVVNRIFYERNMVENFQSFEIKTERQSR